MDPDTFWSKTWAGPEQPGGLHPSCPSLSAVSQSATNPKLRRCLMDVQKALEDGRLDRTKVAVLPHPERMDLWFLRFSNLNCDEWEGFEIIAWLVFDYVPDRGQGTKKPLCKFPDQPPLVGVLTPTGFFTALTGSKWLCLPGLAQGWGSESAAWRTAFNGVADPSPRYNFDVKDTHVEMMHLAPSSRDGYIPILDGSMANYVQLLLSQFEAGAAGWFDTQAEGHVDGLREAGAFDPFVMEEARASSQAWNQQNLGPLMESFTENFGASPPPLTSQQLQRRLQQVQQLEQQRQLLKQQQKLLKRQQKAGLMLLPPSPAVSLPPRVRLYREVRTDVAVKTEAKVKLELEPTEVKQERSVKLEDRLVKQEEPLVKQKELLVKHETPLVKQEKPRALKRAAETAPRSQHKKPKNALVGQRVEVLFNEGEWFAGTVREYLAAGDMYLVKFDDGDQRRLNLDKELAAHQLRWLR